MPLTGVIDCAFCIYSVQALRDTGALQSLVSSEVLHNDDFVHTGETRLICGVTGEVVSVPLVQVTLDSSLCSGTYQCGLVATLPTGIAFLLAMTCVMSQALHR